MGLPSGIRVFDFWPLHRRAVPQITRLREKGVDQPGMLNRFALETTCAKCHDQGIAIAFISEGLDRR